MNRETNKDLMERYLYDVIRRIPEKQKEDIKKEWLEMFRRKEVAGKSVWKKITRDDEWCAEAYLETDYSNISENQFEIELKKYMEKVF